MNDYLITEVETVITNEHVRANHLRGAYNSDDEAYTILKKAVEDVQDSAKGVKKTMQSLWTWVKDDEPGYINTHALAVERELEKVACMAIQSAAVARKLRESQELRGETIEVD